MTPAHNSAPPGSGPARGAEAASAGGVAGHDYSAHAACLASLGVPVFPCRLGQPDANGKRRKWPLTDHGHHDATTDEATVSAWWRRYPDAMPAVPTGPASGLMVVDVDPDGADWYAERSLDLAPGRIHKTERGHHLLYLHADGVGCSNGKVSPGIDVKADGGWVVWWPARGHETVGELDEVTPAPEWLVSSLASDDSQDTASEAVADEIPEGQRDTAFTSLAGTLRRRGLTEAEILDTLRMFNQSRCNPPKDDAELQRIARSVARYEPNDPIIARAVHEGETADDDKARGIVLEPVPLADLNNAPLPEPESIIDRINPCGVVTLIGAHGGTGKTTVALTQAVCVAAGLDFMGLSVHRVPVVFFSAEDNAHVTRLRVKKICNRLGVDPATLEGWLTIYDVTRLDPALYREVMEHGTRFGIETAMYRALSEHTKAAGARYVVIDNASDTFEANENERARVRGFMRALQSLAIDLDAAVELIAHIDKDTAKKGGGSEGYSGSTAWHNSARSRLFLYSESGRLVLEHQKANLGPKAEAIHMAWEGGIPVLAEHAQASNAVNAVVQAQYKRKVLELLAEYYDRGEYIPCSFQAPGNAYRALSGEKGFPPTDRAGLQSIMRELERDELIERETYTTAQRKQRERWKVTDAGLETLGSAPSAPS